MSKHSTFFVLYLLIGLIALRLLPLGVRAQTTMLSYNGDPPANTCRAEFTNWAATNATTGAWWVCNGTSWVTIPPAGGSSVPSGMVAFIDSGTCPSGWTEETHSGDYLLMTQAANGDVGTTGGSTSYTPQGTVAAPVFTGSAGTVPAETFTGSQVTSSATSAGTPAGTNGTASVATTSGSFKGTSSGGFSAIGGSAPGSSFTVPAEAFTGSAMATHTHTVTATGTNSTASFTPVGTNSTPAFTGTGATIQPTYLKLIGCKKN